MWQELGADEALLGATVRVDGAPHTLVGVMPEGFGFPERQSFWTVLAPGESGEVVARLAEGVDAGVVVEAVQARVNALAAARGAQHLPYAVELEPWTTSRDNGGEGAVFVGLALLVALLLVVCSANVSTLLLVRGGGGLLGLAAGYALLHWMQAALSQQWGYYWMTMEVRPRVVAGTFIVVLTTALPAARPLVRRCTGRALDDRTRGGRLPRVWTARCAALSLPLQAGCLRSASSRRSSRPLAPRASSRRSCCAGTEPGPRLPPPGSAPLATPPGPTGP